MFPEFSKELEFLLFSFFFHSYIVRNICISMELAAGTRRRNDNVLGALLAEESGGGGEKEIECYSRRVYRLPISLVRAIHAIPSVSPSLKRGTEGPCAWSSERRKQGFRCSRFLKTCRISRRVSRLSNSFVRWCDNWCFDQLIKSFFEVFHKFL